MSALTIHREEWPEADFDLPDDDEPLHTTTRRGSTTSLDDDEDWDMEMDFGQTGGAKVKATLASTTSRSESTCIAPKAPLQTITIRPPLSNDLDEVAEDDEGISTIKAGVFSKSILNTDTIKPAPIDEDMECDFELPSDLTQLSLAPKSLTHRPSQSSFEWGDKDQTSSSQSSDAFSSLGFTENSSNSNSSASSVCVVSDSEEKESKEEDDLDGLVLPSGAFESAASVKQLTKLLELKKKLPSETFIKVSTPDPEDDFEAGLVFEDDVDLTPSRLRTKVQQKPRSLSRSHPSALRPSSLRPPSRTAKMERSKSPTFPPPSSTKQLNKLRLSPSPPPRPGPSSRTQMYGPLSPVPPPPSQSPFLSPKPGSLRSQKSYNGLKPPTPPSTLQRLARKASLSSLLETSSQASGSGNGGPSAPLKPSRYETPTAASRAKSQKGSTAKDAFVYGVPPARPSTPATSSAALRLTMPTLSRSKSRPALSSVFTPTSPIPHITPSQSCSRATSPVPPRPPSSLSRQVQRSPPRKSPPRRPPTRSQSRSSLNAPTPAPIPQPTLLRRPKRLKTYGDGTELDSIADLPTDREKEVRYRVPAKGRVVGGTYSSKSLEKAAKTNLDQPKRRREGSESGALAPTASSLRRSIDGDVTLSPPKPSDPPSLKRKKTIALNSSGSSQPRKKPTLIRNLGGAGPAKVVGDMKWNPKVLRWEGNDQVLRDFDAAIGNSVRPALITHLTGSSIGSPVPGIVSGARIVGNMMFDPSKMCWVSTLTADEDEPDVFADLADDEDEGWESKGGTIRAALQQLKPPSAPSSDISSSSYSHADGEGASTGRTSGHVSSLSDSGSSDHGCDRGSRPSLVCAVDEAFIETCRKAEARHRQEMKGWREKISPEAFVASDRPHLYEIRALATRKY